MKRGARWWHAALCDGAKRVARGACSTPDKPAAERNGGGVPRGPGDVP
jgi:hypothetical protein